MNKSQDKQLIVKNLSTYFKLDAGLFGAGGKKVYALNNVSFELKKGENYGIVGESGSGKTTLAKTIAGIFKLSEGSFSHLAIVKYVFQDPASSLNPRMNVYSLLTDGYLYSKRGKMLLKRLLKESPEKKKKELLLEKTVAVLKSVGLSNDVLERRPSDFSGGQRQRISLARALMYEPEILICDEVVSALDVSIRSQILNLLVKLKKEYNFSMIFIAHDLSVVSYICDRIGVMIGGRIVEEADAKKLISAPLHPYSQLLYNSMPEVGKKFKMEEKINPELFYNPIEKPVGCPFAKRCPKAISRCEVEIPALKGGERKVACLL